MIIGSFECTDIYTLLTAYNYDQKTHLAVVQTSIHDEEPFEPDVIWIPSDVILSGWIEMVIQGRVCIWDPKSAELDPYADVLGSWVRHLYSPIALSDTIRAFDRLASAIESRMVDSTGIMHREPAEPGIFNTELLPETTISEFVRSFLLQAQKLKAKYLAPGLQLCTPSEYENQPFGSDRDDPDYSSFQPFLHLLLTTQAAFRSLVSTGRMRTQATARAYTKDQIHYGWSMLNWFYRIRLG
ncbi:hypothetical protein P152DRAFT_67441 [Eremomyces bilateralis CBS 781.70]|uniref:Uncharacterized protein n=1 Tax=Eremomyces bilateralis CBS 781.70 TaxID=1392243 RepID=A0A6G1FZH8_9PEZI|nr:uncharacterized protein P152DRAFT_67441 [Eremomyces bilateralis CBS 781.70]KAF1811275.1 hypothetical protein P152DRAFT_67441 [Eremomyces bilateralis CBS 781.70]